MPRVGSHGGINPLFGIHQKCHTEEEEGYLPFQPRIPNSMNSIRKSEIQRETRIELNSLPKFLNTFLEQSFYVMLVAMLGTVAVSLRRTYNLSPDYRLTKDNIKPNNLLINHP